MKQLSLILSLLFVLTAGQAQYQLFHTIPTPFDATFSDGSTYLQVNKSDVAALAADTSRPILQVTVPIKGVEQLLLLQRKNYFAPGFKAVDSEGNVIAVEKPEQFGGYVAGYDSSVAFLSIHEGDVSGTVIFEGETYLIGHQASSHFVVAESVLEKPESIICSEPLEVLESEKKLFPQSYSTDEDGCKYVGVYFEIGNLMVQNKGGVKAATDYLTGLWGVVAYLYEREQINVKITEVKTWTSPEPYSYTSSGAALNDFKSKLGSNFNGNLAHLVNIAPGGLGGVAYVDVLCAKLYPAFSDINGTYSQFPTYSWDAMVITHELGHNFGSPHTQSCTWTLPGGAKGALDNCYSTEGNCSVHPDKPGLSTIMSYCHLTAAGIKMEKGFGEQPGNLIRNRYNAAGCLGSDDCGGGNEKPDLLFTSATITGDGTNTQLEVTVQNVGMAVSGATSIVFLLSPDQTFTTSDHTLKTAQIGSLQINTSQKIVPTGMNWNVPNGSYFVGAIIDPANSVVEQNETNNVVQFSRKVAIDNGGGGGSYCSVTGGSTAYEYIQSVSVGTQSYTNGSLTGYVNELEKTFPVTNNQPITITPGYPQQTKWPEKVAAWIDFNQDGDFTDAGEQVAQGIANKAAYTQNITVPATAKTGKTRMRVTLKFEGQNDQFPLPCDNVREGQTIDYSVNIGESGGCTPPLLSSYAANIADKKTTVTWNFTGTQRAFQLRYRPLGGAWTVVDTGTSSWTIPLLSFEAQVKAACSDWGKVHAVQYSEKTGLQYYNWGN